jgi:hypothetical protein
VLEGLPTIMGASLGPLHISPFRHCVNLVICWDFQHDMAECQRSRRVLSHGHLSVSTCGEWGGRTCGSRDAL